MPVSSAPPHSEPLLSMAKAVDKTPTPTYNPNVGRPRYDVVGVYFRCCRKYVWAHLNRKKTAYVAFCPKCAGKMTIEIRADGSESRFFEAS